MRIRRHFPYNSMNNIAGLLCRSPARAERAIEDMADLFRAMVEDEHELTPVAREIELGRKYVGLEKRRSAFGSRR